MPAISLPLLAVEDAPLGVQLQGHSNRDEAVCAVGRWLSAHALGR
jgi:Asp-tRNA(Asn)/Glu-tRNA(Gln) amidotransferase A subunit family amidase